MRSTLLTVLFKTSYLGVKNLVAEIDDPVDFGRVNVAFMKSSYELSRQVVTFMSEFRVRRSILIW